MEKRIQPNIPTVLNIQELSINMDSLSFITEAEG